MADLSTYQSLLILLINSVILMAYADYTLRILHYYIMSIDPLQSVKNKIHLPSKCNVNKMTRLFAPLSPQTDSNLYELSQPLFNKTNQLVDELNQSFEVFKQENDYVFVFPDSLFPDVPPGERNQITYEQVMISQQENTFKNRLSEEQLEEIAEKGEFKVKSNIEYVTLPYVWKINETLFWGRQKIMLVWKSSLAKIFGIFSQAKRKLFTFVPRALGKLKKIPKNIFEILFGAKSLRTTVTVNYEQEVVLDFWKRIISDYYKQSEEWSSALWNYLFVYYDPQFERPVEYSLDETINMKRQEERRLLTEKYNQANQEANEKMDKIRSVQARFNQEWNKLKKKVILEIGEEVNNINNSIDNKPESEEELLVNNNNISNDNSKNDDKIIELLAERKFSLSLDYMRQELPKENVPLDVINAILVILRLFKVLNSRYSAKTKLLIKKKKEVEQAIKRRHPIKSLYLPFFNQQVNAEYQVIQTAINQEMHENLVKDREFNEFLSESQKAVLREYLKFRANYNTLIDAKKNELKQLHSPSRIFYSNYHLLPPYQVIQTNGYYTLKKISDDLTIDTNTDFWKLKLYWMRIKTWSINCFIALLFLVWNGPTGLRCLYGKDEFDFEMEINYQTGEVYYQKRKTVIGTFLTVIEGIRKSRANFEATPDLGLLGKNISRYFNYMECYLFRFLFVGVIVTLIGYPIVIIIASAISAVLVITIWAWVPIILLVTYIFNIFIYQFQTALIPDRMIIRSIPIFSIIFHILRSVIVTLLLTLNLILLAPIKAFFILLFSLIQRGFRTVLDKLLLFLFRKVGRTPSRDTSIARKISGPGMSKQFYMSINEEDVYVLMQSKLEQVFMQKFSQLIEGQIQENKTRANQMFTAVLKPFNSYSQQGLYYISNNSNNLLQNYRRQYYNYIARYPSFPSRVRFTQEEIDNYFDNTVNIVRNFVTKYEIEKWIFERYVLYEDMYDELTRSLWMEIFSCGEEIFEPLEKLDARFKLQDQYHSDNEQFNMKMKKNVNQIVKSLEGEVQLSHNRHRVAPFKHNLINREQRSQEISHVFDLWTSNSQTRMNLNRQTAHTTFIPNLNINQLSILFRQRRERAIKANPDIVDL